MQPSLSILADRVEALVLHRYHQRDFNALLRRSLVLDSGRWRQFASKHHPAPVVFDTIQCSLYSLPHEAYWKLDSWPGRVMYNVDLARNLCKTITREKDVRKSAELLALLRAVMREDQEEIRVRMAFLANNYSLIGSESQAAD
jgi:hypothetical protein